MSQSGEVTPEDLVSGEETVHANATTAPPQSSNWFMKLGRRIVAGMEYVGEIVADVLGIDDAKYQDVYDSMTEEELAEAQRVNDQRNLGHTLFE